MAVRKKAPARRAPAKKSAARKIDPKQRILEALHKKFGKESATTLADEMKAAGQIKEFIPTGVDVIDNHLLARGGLPVGRWSEWFGPEGCGKTALAYTALGMCQRRGGVAVLIDAEHSFDEVRAQTFGVNIEDLIIVEPESLELCFDEVRTTLDTHDASCPMLIAWDSIAAMVPDSEVDQDAHGKKQPARVAAVMSSEMKKINRLLAKKRAHVMMINQVRTNIGVMFGSNVSTPGGNAVKFYASIRGQFFGGKSVKDKKKAHIAKVVTVMMIKTRLSPPFRKARVRFDYDTGYNNLWTTIEHAKELELIDPREDGYKGKGREGIDAYFDALSELGWSPAVPITELRAKDSDTGAGEEIDDGDDED